ncbi:c-type heme family protein [Sulfurimonas sp.]|uniref:c-type heme family protein n=1 Tax=Sulfurimonas sp. TaxID=2022749 RepID=UPI003D140C3C
MLNKLLNYISLLLVFLFVGGSIGFYYELEDFYEKEAYKHIKEHVVFSGAMQKFFYTEQQPEIYQLMYDYNISQDFFNPKILSATYMIAHINKDFQKTLQGEMSREENTQFQFVEHNLHVDSQETHAITFKFASDNPLNQENKANIYEANILKNFRDKNIHSISEKIEKDSKEYLVYAIPSMPNNALCLQCHGDPSSAPKDLVNMYGTSSGFHEKEGDIRAALVIYSEINSSNMMLFYILTESVMILALLFIYATVRYFLVQLNSKDQVITKQARFAAMGEMLGMIAHQWRQPLTGMGITTNNLLLDIELGEVDNERLKSNLDVINQQIAYLSSTIDDFRNFSQPNRKLEQLSLKKIVDESLIVINSTLEKNNVIIHNDVDPSIEVTTLRNDLMQIFLNLIKNSMEAYIENNIDERTIEISAEILPNKSVALKVKDYAGGVPQDIREKIFEPYFSTKNKKNSTGLGLYMSKMIASDHLNTEIKLEVQNNSSIFTLIIPKNTGDSND